MNTTEKLPLIQLIHDGQAMLGVDVGPAGSLPRSFGQSLSASIGYLVSDDGSHSPWTIDGVGNHDGRLIVRMPAPRGLELAPAKMEHVIRSLLALQTTGYSPASQFTPIAFLRCEGATLVLPERLADLTMANLIPEQRAELVEPYRFPASRPLDRFQFGLAVAVYRELCGTFPFIDTQDLPLEWARLHGRWTPAACHGLILHPDLVRLLEQIFDHQIFPSTLAAWQFLPDLLAAGTAATAAGPVERAAGERRREAMVRNGRRAVWWHRHWVRLAVISAAVLLVATVPLTMLSKAMEPPRTLGQNPPQVIEGFYAALGNFDLAYWDDALENADRHELVNQTTNTMLAIKVREGTERTRVSAPALEWLESGAQPVPGDFHIVGASNVRIVQVRYLSRLGGYEYTVEYDWYNTFMDQSAIGVGEAGYTPVPSRHRDTFTMVWHKGAWQMRNFASIIVQPDQ